MCQVCREPIWSRGLPSFPFSARKGGNFSLIRLANLQLSNTVIGSRSHASIRSITVAHHSGQVCNIRVKMCLPFRSFTTHLVQRGLETLRHSGEPKAPHLYITIPGGKLIVYRPNRPIGVFDIAFTFGLGKFARLAFTATQDTPFQGQPGAQPQNGMLSLWTEVDIQQEIPART